MIPDYLNQIQRQIPYYNLISPDKEINLYDDQICDHITKEIYNYLIYRYICLGYNDLYAIFDFRPDPVLLVPDIKNPLKVLGPEEFSAALILFLETPSQPTIRFHLLISKHK